MASFPILRISIVLSISEAGTSSFRMFLADLGPLILHLHGRVPLPAAGAGATFLCLREGKTGSEDGTIAFLGTRVGGFADRGQPE